MNNNLLKGSDKEYWHRYIPMYEEALSKLTNCNRILEFGVFKGDSIRWINNKYPNAEIYGCDILSVQPEWTIAENIKYYYVDQGKLETIKDVFASIGNKLDLIIEDGSHFPEHQRNCLIEGLKHMNKGGIFILEDLHTSLPDHQYYKKGGSNYIGPLHVLLYLEHLISTEKEIDRVALNDFSKNSLFSPQQVIDLFENISEIKIYKRATLPHKCYSCGSTDFKYHTLKCKCGVDLYSNTDSMTAVIKVK